MIRYALDDQATRRAVFEYGFERAKELGADSPLISCFERASREPPTNYHQRAGWVLIAFHNALYHLTKETPFRLAISETILAGGDRDTNAAICGGLLGAVDGLSAIPEDWRTSTLTSRPAKIGGKALERPASCWPVDALHIAEQLVALRSGDD